MDDYINELLDWMVGFGIITAEQADRYRPGISDTGDSIDIAGTYVGTYKVIPVSSEISDPPTGRVNIDITLTDETTNTYSVVYWMSAVGDYADGFSDITLYSTDIAVFDDNTGLINYNAVITDNEILTIHIIINGTSLTGTVYGSSGDVTFHVSFSATKQ